MKWLISAISTFLFAMNIVHANDISTGSGFFISSDGYFVTNYHVIAGSDNINLRDIKGRIIAAKVVRSDPANDLAILKANGHFSYLAIDDSKKVKPGAAIVAIGFPHISVQGVEPKVTDGIVNSLTGLKDDPRYFQISAPLQSGNSGGPLLNFYGNVIGVNSSKLAAGHVYQTTGDLTQNVNYAVKSNYLSELVLTIQSLKNSLKKPLTKKQSDISQVYEIAENSIALVIAESKQGIKQKPTPEYKKEAPRNPPKLESPPQNEFPNEKPKTLSGWSGKIKLKERDDYYQLENFELDGNKFHFRFSSGVELTFYNKPCTDSEIKGTLKIEASKQDVSMDGKSKVYSSGSVCAGKISKSITNPAYAANYESDALGFYSITMEKLD